MYLVISRRLALALPSPKGKLLLYPQLLTITILGDIWVNWSLSNDGEDSNENGKKAIGLQLLTTWLFWGTFGLIGSFKQWQWGQQYENGKKAIGLDKQNNNFAAGASHFFVYFLPS